MARGFYTGTSIEVRDNLSGPLASLRPAIQKAAIKAVQESGEIIRADAYQRANVSPGERGNAVDGSHMRDNIKVDAYDTPWGAQGRIGIDLSIVPYAPHQEFGPNGKPFLRPATDENRDRVHQRMAEVFREELDLNMRVNSRVGFKRFA